LSCTLEEEEEGEEEEEHILFKLVFDCYVTGLVSPFYSSQPYRFIVIFMRNFFYFSTYFLFVIDAIQIQYYDI